VIAAARPALLLLALASAGAPQMAQAGAPSSTETNHARALSLYDQGNRLLQAGDAKASLPPLEESMTLLPSPNTELLIGHALRLDGKKALALVRYGSVRTSAKERVAAGEARFSPTLDDAERWIAKLAPDVAELSVNVMDAPDGAALFVNGRELPWLAGSSGAVRAARTYEEPGVAHIELRVAGRAIAQADAQLARGATRLVTLEAGSAATPSPPDVDDPGRGIPAPPIAAWVAGGIGAAGMISFAAAGGLALSKANELDACAPACDPDDPDAREARDTGKTAALVANVSVAIGGAGLVTGALLWIFWPREATPTPSVTLDVGPASLGVRGRF
jgi:hypothetical protein